MPGESTLEPAARPDSMPKTKIKAEEKNRVTLNLHTAQNFHTIDPYQNV